MKYVTNCAKTPRATNAALEVGDVDACVEEILRQSSYFDSWYERLVEELGHVSADHARAILAACAKDVAGAPTTVLANTLGALTSNEKLDQELRFLLDVLQNDGYLVESAGRYGFRSNLLREFWLRRYA